MKDYFTEILIVIAYSGRTQAAIIFGMIGFIAITLIGDHYLSNFHLSGQMSGLTDIIKEKLAYRYDKAAWGVLFSFWCLAFKLYHKDKKRLWSRF
ncbi:MAG: hypothetical protein WC856_09625 [Methylococcaceae bacterium]|jgi:hypothetical protein